MPTSAGAISGTYVSSTPSVRKTAKRGTHSAETGIVRQTSVKPIAMPCQGRRSRVMANPVSEAQATVSGTAMATIVSEFSNWRPSGTSAKARSNAPNDGSPGMISHPTGGGCPGACSAPSSITASGTENRATTSAAASDLRRSGG